MASSSGSERKPEKEKEEEEDKEEEEECTVTQMVPLVKLPQVAVTTGEEEEHLLLHLKAKLYRFDKKGNEWKERGIGTVKLLKHKDTQKVRLVMRQSKTLKICANHLVLPSLSMQVHAGNSKSCVWHATDFSDGKLKEELFCIRFSSTEDCKAFNKMIEEVTKPQEDVEESAEENEEATSATNLLEKLSVEQRISHEEETKEASYVSIEEEWVIV